MDNNSGPMEMQRIASSEKRFHARKPIYRIVFESQLLSKLDFFEIASGGNGGGGTAGAKSSNVKSDVVVGIIFRIGRSGPLMQSVRGM